LCNYKAILNVSNDELKKKTCLQVVPVHAMSGRMACTMTAYKGVDVWRHAFLFSALAGGEQVASCLACSTPREIALLLSEYEAVWAPEQVSGEWKNSCPCWDWNPRFSSL